MAIYDRNSPSRHFQWIMWLSHFGDEFIINQLSGDKIFLAVSTTKKN